ncbi:hypothetical protein AO069_04315 [Pseudomonas syringae pv. syringae PD2774]|nr:hypothetical protein AO069_04315 [Pseudomonas syringae pv. syringae PD2774]
MITNRRFAPSIIIYMRRSGGNRIRFKLTTCQLAQVFKSMLIQHKAFNLRYMNMSFAQVL